MSWGHLAEKGWRTTLAKGKINGPSRGVTGEQFRCSLPYTLCWLLTWLAMMSWESVVFALVLVWGRLSIISLLLFCLCTGLFPGHLHMKAENSQPSCLRSEDNCQLSWTSLPCLHSSDHWGLYLLSHKMRNLGNWVVTDFSPLVLLIFLLKLFTVKLFFLCWVCGSKCYINKPDFSWEDSRFPSACHQKSLSIPLPRLEGFSL